VPNDFDAMPQITSQGIEQQFAEQSQAPQPEAAVAVAEPTIATPAPRPASKTLAAIFANMPQPRTDVASSVAVQSANPTVVAPIDETVDPVAIADQIEELTNQMADNAALEEPVQTAVRESAATIQIDTDGVGVTDSIPLQRRTSVRPVDLAKSDETPPTSQASIDSVFSQLKPPSQEVQGRLASPSDSQLLEDEEE